MDAAATEPHGGCRGRGEEEHGSGAGANIAADGIFQPGSDGVQGEGERRVGVGNAGSKNVSGAADDASSGGGTGGGGATAAATATATAAAAAAATMLKPSSPAFYPIGSAPHLPLGRPPPVPSSSGAPSGAPSPSHKDGKVEVRKPAKIERTPAPWDVPAPPLNPLKPATAFSSDSKEGGVSAGGGAEVVRCLKEMSSDNIELRVQLPEVRGQQQDQQQEEKGGKGGKGNTKGAKGNQQKAGLDVEDGDGDGGKDDACSSGGGGYGGIFIKTSTGKTLTLSNVELSMTVGDIKAMIQEVDWYPGESSSFASLGVSLDRYCLVFGGEQLENSCSLEHYNIERESTLHIKGVEDRDGDGGKDDACGSGDGDSGDSGREVKEEGGQTGEGTRGVGGVFPVEPISIPAEILCPIGGQVRRFESSV